MNGELPHEAYLAALASLAHLGPVTFRRLLGLGPPVQVWEMVRAGRLPPRVLADLPPGSPGRAQGWRESARALDPAAVWARCVRLGVGVTSLGSSSYPQVLRQDPEPPVVLFHLGDPDVLAGPRVAVVGTRRATGYGLRFAHHLGSELASAGVCVVSGLALGIDAAAHAGAVDQAGAPPAAVVGGGLDAPGPVRNAALARRVARTGVVLSEVPPGVAAQSWRFPVRNRILAGLADVVVVVESGAGGGSMITVREAQRRDRPVLAVPGPVDSPASDGTNQLVSEGATVCRDADDVLCALGLEGAVPRSPAPPDQRPLPAGPAAAVLDQLGWRPSSLDQLAAACGLGLEELSGALRWLEDHAWVESRGGFVERVARATIRAPDGHRL